jgi:hypothetical protein
MTLTLSPTAELVHVNGTLCRVWTGQTERGQAVDVFVATIRVADGADLAAESGGDLFETDDPILSPGHEVKR